MTETNEPAKYDKVTKECHLIGDKQVGYVTSSLGFEPGTTGNKSSQSSGKDLNSWPPDCKTSALIRGTQRGYSSIPLNIALLNVF